MRLDAGLSQKAVGDRLGVDQSVVSHREHGRRRVPASDLERLVEMTGQGLILTPRGWDIVEPPDPLAPPPETHYSETHELVVDIPVFGISEDRWAEAVAQGQLNVCQRWQRTIDGVLEIQDDAMAPLLQVGDWVGVILGAEFVIDDVVVASVGKKRSLVVRVYSGDDDGHPVLIATNPRYDSIRGADVEVRGVTSWLWREGPIRLD